jgi:septal ring factor EnvC (AmiA/AmiB activator)
LFYYADVLFFQALHLTKSQIARKEANAQLRMELNATHSKMAEVEHREQALTSVYEDLKKDFNDVCYSHAAVVKEKNELEKTEREKEWRFWNSS